ncbi:expressed unknown protein [Seminavis robusta]|uniref:RING-type domain-containing protein n=1 Tax=Seminavis robusta TaxID=568900 RepID=A0A9N8DT16_9STRA|nr:expressed unknown protein [Seminavis robusta]|eukprot:Sro322_g116930.1 n/a (202) ;mRNA; f:9052-10019
MAHQCTICYEQFDYDASAEDRSHLPVQSRVCAHTLCYSCMIAIYQATPPSYDDDKEEIVAIPCPECRLPGAHDPYNPIVSLPMCHLLEERDRHIEKHPELALPESPQIPRKTLSRQQLLLQQPPSSSSLSSSQLPDDAELTHLLAAAAKQKVDNLWHQVREKMTVERPLVRLTKEASRAVYWGSILVFGTVDREAVGHTNK